MDSSWKGKTISGKAWHPDLLVEKKKWKKSEISIGKIS
jgi:hypothetical protein